MSDRQLRAAASRRGGILKSHVSRLMAAMLALAATAGLSGAQRTPSPGSLDSAQAAVQRAPEDLSAILWHGRFVGYTGDFERAVAIYTDALRTRPDEPWLLRHRGHRYISLRQFESAVRDLQRAYDLTSGRADEVEPDGQPNARGIPTSTLKSNIRYHLALAHFLQGNFPAAATYWEEDAKVAANLDQRVAATYWWVVAMARAGNWEGVRAALAPIRADWEIIENGSYHRLLLFMKGELTQERLMADLTTPLERQTVGNGVAQWHLARGDRARATLAVREVLASGPSASFGFLGAEVLAKELGVR